VQIQTAETLIEPVACFVDSTQRKSTFLSGPQ
jgi:hypothetical protein